MGIPMLCLLMIIAIVHLGHNAEAGKCPNLEKRLKDAQTELERLRNTGQCECSCMGQPGAPGPAGPPGPPLNQPKDCPKGFTKNEVLKSCHKFITNTKLMWTDALAFCQSLQANLVAIETHVEQLYLADKLTNGDLPTETWYWTGGNELCGTWEWAGGLSWTPKSITGYLNWDTTYELPQPQANDERCLGLHSEFTYKWHDLTCKSEEYFICEINLS
ncbi:unnamed protein product [Owenia fusiformis]|uniref:Uncharacterized protein n=1 Tax=Owenia fusiformis TaxID=6347 RepID=A0A8J1UCK4_OWEFU|nr:unnamed protein product [Owenia fusiformis]